ncbi:MAG: hypothetical protein ACI8RZ_002683, partial [Myxococcota bacterium]
AIDGRIDHWAETPQGAAALVVVLDQFSRNLRRGTADMFVADDHARAITRAAIDRGDLAVLPPALIMVHALCLEHAEDLPTVREALELLHQLTRDPITRGNRKRYKRVRSAAFKHVSVLDRYGRYPHRNALLGRTSTPRELQYLHDSQEKFVRSVKPHTTRRLKILVLHSFRQSARRLSSRTGALRRALGDLAELVYVDAPHAYQATGAIRQQVVADFGEDMAEISGQRCWWNSGEDHAIYDGVEETLEYLEGVFAEQGPFDGVIGFSQGGAVAGLLAAMQPFGAIQMKFVICISGFPSRAEVHRTLGEAKIALPSLHVFGEKDVLVDNSRTLALSEWFAQPAVASHPGGHFFPEKWPMDTISAFLTPFAEAVKPLERAPLTLFDPDALPGLDALLCDTPTETVSAVSAAVSGLSDNDRAMRLDDLRTLALLQHQPYSYSPVQAITEPLPGDAMYRLWLAVAEVSGEHTLRRLVDHGGWSALTRLAVIAHRDFPGSDFPGSDFPGSDFPTSIAAFFAEQLRLDEAALKEDAVISSAALAAPRHRSATDRCCRLGRDIARLLFPEDEKVDSYRGYRYLITRLSSALRPSSRQARPSLPSQVMTPWSAAAFSAPISPEIIEPKPMPVVPSPLTELTPLLEHLSDNIPTPNPKAFTRGTLMTDGRLDLCKQVVGPAGIGPLLSAVSGNPQVRRLLLGNNIVGNAGAAEIADFITSGHSPVKVWYIAGNQIDAEGIVSVVDALCERTDVEGLWLKRNPLKPAGAVEVARLIRADTPIETLDLVNTGLLDDGAAVIADALWDNHNLRHLYLGTNGITPAGLAPLVRYLGESNRLESLFISCNRIGDEGAKMLAEALKRDRSLVRLGLSSDRIGPAGAIALAEAITDHPTLRYLDLGWTRATAAVGELGNRVGNTGCRAMATMLRSNQALQALDLSHNDISQRAIDAITESLEVDNTTLVSLRHPQFGKAINHDALGRLHALLERNRAAAGVDPEEIRTPTPTREIMSVYRTA